jgi:hypothetical protein
MRQRLLIGVVAVALVAGVMASRGLPGGVSGARMRAVVPTGKLAVITPGGVRLEVARLDGSERRLLATVPGAIQQAVWSPRGDRIAVSFGRAGSSKVDTLVLDEHGRVQAKVRGGLFSSSWSDDGRYLVTDGSAQPVCKSGAAVKRQLHLLVYDTGGRLLHDLPVRTAPPPAQGRPKDSADTVSEVAWSPSDGRLAYVVSKLDCFDRGGLGTSALYAVNLVDGKQAVVEKSLDWSRLIPAWAPDGRSLALLTDCLAGGPVGDGCGTLVTVSADGRKYHVLLGGDSEQPLDYLVYWPNANMLVFGILDLNAHSRLGTINPRTGKERWLISVPSSAKAYFRHVRLSASRRSVVSDLQVWNGADVQTLQIVVSPLDGSRGSRTAYALGDDSVADVWVP